MHDMSPVTPLLIVCVSVTEDGKEKVRERPIIPYTTVEHIYDIFTDLDLGIKYYSTLVLDETCLKSNVSCVKEYCKELVRTLYKVLPY